MIRYFRLYLFFVRFSFSRALEFRADFTFRIFMDLIYYTVNLLFYKIVFLNMGDAKLAGWREDQIMVFVAGYLMVDAVVMTIFSNNFWWLPESINRGDLDYYLTRPVSSLFFLSLRDFAANSFMNLLMTFGIFVWALDNYQGPVTAGGVALFVALLGVGVLLYYCLRLLTIIPIFWMHSGRGLEQLFWTTTRLMERPDRIFTGWVRRILISILPFGLMASFPARIFLEGLDWWLLLHLLGTAAAFFCAVVFSWRLGLRAYSSASS